MKKQSKNNNEKKEEIAEMFLEFFLENGMVNTIVSDVAKKLHMSKKTIYKFFHGGKKECLYFIFYKIALESIKQLDEDLISISKYEDKLDITIRFIFEQTVPYVLGNAAKTDEDYLIENRIVGTSFKDAYKDRISTILQMGIDNNEFSNFNVKIIFRFIYGLISESMVIIHENPRINIIDEVIWAIKRIILTKN